jgi:glycosyltransferase involved in cell wall biosynthesis
MAPALKENCATGRRTPELITVRDFSPDIVRHYQAASLLLFPSLREGLPNTVLEAMACGLPCLVARAPGSRELVRDGLNGATFAVDDAAELESAVHRVLAAPEELGARGRQLAVEQYQIGVIADRYEELYAHLLERRHGAFG